MFEPKIVLNPVDWLATQREKGQGVHIYQGGGPTIRWLNAKSDNRVERIILLVLDSGITHESASKFKAYCQAFFDPLPV